MRNDFRAEISQSMIAEILQSMIAGLRWHAKHLQANAEMAEIARFAMRACGSGQCDETRAKYLDLSTDISKQSTPVTLYQSPHPQHPTTPIPRRDP